MQTTMFKKKVSKGSRFNQVYIPKYLENEIEVGDEVEVKLIKKHTELYYPKELKLSKFKEDLTKDIFSFLTKFNEILDVFVVGSFLFSKIDYMDIDVVIITEKGINNFDKFVYDELINKFDLKFHVISIEKERFEYLLKVCPLTRAMFSIYVSNQKINLEREKIIDKKHLNFLLMMPTDLLEIRLSSRVFFDNLRRLITIERFLDNKKLNLDEINLELKDLLSERLYERIKNNEEINEKKIEDIRKVIRDKLKNIKEKL